MTTTKTFDFLNRLQLISSAAGSTVSAAYKYNNANQRTENTLPDSSFWLYQYDSLGQVTSGKKYWSDWTPVAGQQFEYVFDDIGNRTSTKAGGDSTGANLQSASYSASFLNQLTNRTVPGNIDVLGVANAAASVTVNGQGTYRKTEYYYKGLATNNGSAALYVSITNQAVLSGATNTTIGNVFVPKTPEIVSYDADGNQTNDGRWMLTWDAENRLAAAESQTTAPTASKRKVAFVFDWQGRTTRRTEYDGSSGSYVLSRDEKYIYDGSRCLAELNATNNTVVRGYLWGLDVSGTPTGAGGVGGLLAMNSAANGEQFYAMDGNGNVAALVKAADGTGSANYEYDPFGQTIRISGTSAKDNALRFSTKRYDETLDFAQYEYRPYKPPTGMWLSRDPLADEAFFINYAKAKSRKRLSHRRDEASSNAYMFLKNTPPNDHDPFGLSAEDVSNIQGAAIAAFFELCDSCKRCDNGILLNNNLQIAFGAPYLGCGDQALSAQNRIMPTLQAADDRWTPDIPRIFRPGPHQFLVLKSSNSEDPTISVDPYDGVIRMNYPAEFQGSFFTVRVDTISLRCNPRTAGYQSSRYTYDLYE